MGQAGFAHLLIEKGDKLGFLGGFILNSYTVPTTQDSRPPGIETLSGATHSSPAFVPFPAAFEQQSFSANGITMYLIDSLPEGENYRLEICYDLPDHRDWLATDLESPYTTFIQFDETKIYPMEEGTIGWAYSAGDAAIGRCQYLIFARPNPAFNEMTLIVQGLFLYYKTGPDECDTIQDKMLEFNNFSSFECMNVKGIDGLAIVKAPHQSFREGILQQAWSRLNLVKERRYGPWQFDFVMQHPQ